MEAVANKTKTFDKMEDIIADFKQGKMVILLDDEDRENEGDLLIAAECVTAADINFMAKYGRGLICLTLTEKRCKQLNLPLMVSDKKNNNAPFGTRFTVSVEAAQGVTTGISAADRATTIQACIKDDASPYDIVQPGHIFPIMAQPGGVLTRAGHTEANCDLARLAGFKSEAAVLVEILNEDGTMARRDDLLAFAQRHGLKIGTIADLIKYRLNNEKTVEQVSETIWPTKYGEFKLRVYIDHITGYMHHALVKGDLSKNKIPYVRVHVENKVTDILFYNSHNKNDLDYSVASGWPLDKSIEYISKQDCGVVLILESDKSNRDILNYINKNTESKLTDKNYQQKVLRRIGIGSQILSDIGITKMNLLSKPVQYFGLAGFNLEVEKYISFDGV